MNCFSLYILAIDENVEIPAWESRPPPRKAHWKLSIRGLRDYKDLLAPYILNEYGLDDLEDSSDECEEDPLAESSGRVEHWLHGNHSQSDDIDLVDSQSCHMFGISTLQEDDTSVLDPIVELGNYRDVTLHHAVVE